MEVGNKEKSGRGLAVLYFGANRAGIECLCDLLDWGVEINAVVVRFSDQGEDSTFPSLKKFAAEKKLHIFQPDKPNTLESINFYKSFHFDYLISVQYDKILKQTVLSLPKKGAINLHFAPLPKYRGCYPISWAIIEGENAGITLHWIDKGIDTGDIIGKREIPTVNRTAKEIYELATDSGRKLFSKLLPRIFKGEKIRYPQDNKVASYHPKGEPYERIIHWSWNAQMLERFVRAFTFSPFPSARTYCGHYEIEILYPIYSIADALPRLRRPGTILNIEEGKTLKVQCGYGVLKIPHYRLRLNNKYIDCYSEIQKLTGIKEGSVLGGDIV